MESGIKARPHRARRRASILPPASVWISQAHSTDKRNGSVEGGSISRSIMIELVAKTAAACIGNCIVRRLSTLIAVLSPWHKRTYEGVAGFLWVKQSRSGFTSAKLDTGPACSSGRKKRICAGDRVNVSARERDGGKWLIDERGLLPREFSRSLLR